MLDQLMQLISQHGQDAVVNNSAVPNEHNEAVMQEAGSSIFSGLQSALAGGGLSSISNLFSGSAGQNAGISGLVSNPVVQNIIQQLTGNLSNKFNLSPETAQSVSSNLVPNVLQNLSDKANDPNDSSIDLQGILGSLGGGNLQDMLGKFTQGNSGSGGGLMDSLGGLFGK